MTFEERARRAQRELEERGRREVEERLGKRVSALEAQRHESRRREFVDGAIATGRVTEAERASIEIAFDASPEATIALVSGRPSYEPVARTFTADESRAYAEHAAARLGLTKDEIV